MDERWRETFAAWATTAEHRARVGAAEAIIRETLHTARQPYVSASGGKDSGVLVHLVTRQAPDVMVLHWDYGRTYVPAPLHREIIANLHAGGARAVRVETSSAYARLGNRAVNVLGRQMIGKLLPRLAAEGYDAAFVGLRRAESLKRTRRMRAYRMVGPIPEVWPLADWGWMDVLAYTVAHALPLLSVYAPRAALVGWEHARFTTLFDPEFADVGSEMDGVLHWRWRNGALDG